MLMRDTSKQQCNGETWLYFRTPHIFSFIGFAATCMWVLRTSAMVSFCGHSVVLDNASDAQWHRHNSCPLFCMAG